MTREEFGKWAMALRSYYPAQNLLPTKQSAELWYMQLADIPYKVAVLALNKWVALNRWGPTIADLREAAADCMAGEIPDWSEAWEHVMKAIQYHGTWDVEGAKAMLTPLERQVVERIGFVRLCMSENITADRAGFRDIYTGLAKRQKEQAQLPEKLVVAMRVARIGAKEENEAG